MWFIEIFCVKQGKVQFILFISERDKMLQLPKTACETHSRISRDIQSKIFYFFSDIYIYFWVGDGGTDILMLETLVMLSAIPYDFGETFNISEDVFIHEKVSPV